MFVALCRPEDGEPVVIWVLRDGSELYSAERAVQTCRGIRVQLIPAVPPQPGEDMRFT